MLSELVLSGFYCIAQSCCVHYMYVIVDICYKQYRTPQRVRERDVFAFSRNWLQWENHQTLEQLQQVGRATNF